MLQESIEAAQAEQSAEVLTFDEPDEAGPGPGSSLAQQVMFKAAAKRQGSKEALANPLRHHGVELAGSGNRRAVGFSSAAPQGQGGMGSSGRAALERQQQRGEQVSGLALPGSHAEEEADDESSYGSPRQNTGAAGRGDAAGGNADLYDEDSQASLDESDPWSRLQSQYALPGKAAAGSKGPSRGQQSSSAGSSNSSRQQQQQQQQGRGRQRQPEAPSQQMQELVLEDSDAGVRLVQVRLARLHAARLPVCAACVTFAPGDGTCWQLRTPGMQHLPM